MSSGDFVWRCASSASPSATWAFLFNFPCPVGQCDQGSARKMWVSSRSLEIFLFTFLDWPDFILQIIDFCSGCLSRSYEICIQTTFSRWRQCKRIQIVNFKRCKTRAESTCSSCSASGCVLNSSMLRKKIMKTVSLSSSQPVALECVCIRFLLVKRPIPHVDKILDPKLRAVSSCAAC